ncbi:ABC-type glycerol-3-phosphate transport system substrate-binding protein [Motilibacter rhizosphaerae]|uniref:ABC-type glycerol-3-phosphate transport system substrate-binding protein n=1 Tax=Motilibacter rhizosphaerae TaxID=598652 RepID=A0A4Q7NVP1_9ACTN|nr:extracellular solute-binding protein [Motilibacter rhizosphaerae]RZS91336.1 ABC-type glycerol-3-phosphate transport system substrate-binding protein [Motilibacter rhizosphaerae]
MTLHRRSSRPAAVVALATGLCLVAGCGTAAKKTDSAASGGTQTTTAATGTSSAPAAAPAGQKVKLSVVSLLPGSTKEAFKAFNDQVAIFEQAHPDIDVQPHEYEWKGTTFAAQLAGGTLPTVFEVPFTDARTLIGNKQVADLTAQVRQLPYAGTFNPSVLAQGQDSKGDIYALPKGAYGVGLQYNRALFTKAGLDPDKPPTTWDEVRADARAIASKTHQAGFALMGKSNTGGWNLAMLTYALGGRLETVDSSGKATVTLANPGTKAALQWLKQLRWSDNAMGSNFLLDWGSMNQAFAAGKVGMYLSGSDVYTNLVQANHVKPETYGLTVLPMSDSPDAGLLGGGTEVVVKASATDAEKAAAVKWMDFYYLSKLTDQQAAVRDAKTLVASKQPVGTPQLPLFDKATLDTYMSWISSYVDVPLGQMKGFTDNIFNQKLQPEPPVSTQALYGVLDTVVQKVLTDKGTNIDQLLAKTTPIAQQAVDKAS